MFIYGGLLLFCGICGSVSAVFQDEKTQAMQAEIQKEAPGLMALSIGTNVTYLVLGVLFLVAGIGVLRLVKLFRTAAYFACATIVLVTIVSSVYTAIYVFPIQQRLIMQELEKNNPPMPFDMGKVMAASQAFGLLVAICVPLVFCVPIVILLNRKAARDAFAGIAPGPEDDDPYAIRRLPRRDEDADGYHEDYPLPKLPHAPGDTGITDKGQ
jgi:hypothetical protein